MSFLEANFDGIVGPTHSYAGLAFGNLASAKNRDRTSRPREAALQGLRKMKWLLDLGIPQGVFPPLSRPKLELLHRLGFRGSAAEMFDSAYRDNPKALAACFSSSNMWTANAATVSPSPDTYDGRVHLTPANLVSSLHRAIEAAETTQNLRTIFADTEHFCVHDSLPPVRDYSDEGAANHTRLSSSFENHGWELFTFGQGKAIEQHQPSQFPARQTELASQAIGRLHGLSPAKTWFIQQHPQAIDAGVFHNDVISVGHLNVLLIHETALLEQTRWLKVWQDEFEKQFETKLHVIQIEAKDLAIKEAVDSYLFNSQIISQPNGKMMLIAPSECQENLHAKSCIEKIVDERNPIESVEFFDLRESMQNGGGPACLRLRVVLSEDQRKAVLPGVWLDEVLYKKLVAWVQKHYREEVQLDDLRDPNWVDETENALADLRSIINWPNCSASSPRNLS